MNCLEGHLWAIKHIGTIYCEISSIGEKSVEDIFKWRELSWMAIGEQVIDSLTGGSGVSRTVGRYITFWILFGLGPETREPFEYHGVVMSIGKL
jgi:hypothetical protein